MWWREGERGGGRERETETEIETETETETERERSAEGGPTHREKKRAATASFACASVRRGLRRRGGRGGQREGGREKESE